MGTSQRRYYRNNRWVWRTDIRPSAGDGQYRGCRLRPPTNKECWLALRAGSGHRAVDLAENGADAAGDTWHDGTGRDGHETCHQSVFDKVLTVLILPDLQFEYEISNPYHFCIFPLSVQPINMLSGIV